MRPLWLFVVGCVLEGFTVVAVLTSRGLGQTIFLGSVGGVCLLASLAMPLFQEGILQAGPGGLRVAWKSHVTEQVAEVLNDELQQETPSPAASTVDLGGLTFPPATSVHLADVNHDGEPELVVQSPVGAHMIRLRAFGWQGPTMEPEFGQILEKVSNLGVPYTIGDLDADGRTEIATIDTDWSKPGANNATGPFAELLLRWDGEDFAEVGRREIGSDLASVQFVWFKPRPGLSE